MEEHQKEIIKFTSEQVLLFMLETAIGVATMNPWYRVKKVNLEKYGQVSWEEYKERIKYLKRMGYIQGYIESKENYLELTQKGLKRAKQVRLENVIIKKPERWDGKWRVVVFDIKEKRHSSRNAFRDKLLKLGFVKIQGSVYVYPYECAKEVMSLAECYWTGGGVIVMIADIIQGEEVIIESFISKGILARSDLRK